MKVANRTENSFPLLFGLADITGAAGAVLGRLVVDPAAKLTVIRLFDRMVAAIANQSRW